jgi:hypothetical protein
MMTVFDCAPAALPGNLGTDERVSLWVDGPMPEDLRPVSDLLSLDLQSIYPPSLINH